MNTEATINEGANNLNTGIGLDEAAESSAFLAELGIEVEQEEVEETSDEELESESQEEDHSEDEVEDESEEADEQEGEGETEDEPAEYYVVTIGDEELEVTEDELLSGYQRQRDYTRKTQELADERKSLKAELESLHAEREKYVKALEQVLEEESKELESYNDIDWDTLRAENPNEFLMKQYEMNQVRQRLTDKKQAREEALKGSNTFQETQERELIAREQSRVKELVEGWEGENHTQLVETLRDQANKEGFTDEDAALFKHAQVIKLLQKANKFDELMAKKETVVKNKVERKVPKVVKTGNKSDSAESKSLAQQQKHMERFKKSGKLEDSVSVFERYI